MEFKGTKGKWYPCYNWSNKNVEIGTPSEEKIALVNKDYVDEYKANALLISKAPEMLEMLKVIKDHLIDILEEYGSESAEKTKAIRDCKLLIKQATEL